MLSAPVDPGGARTNNSHTPAGRVQRVPASTPEATRMSYRRGGTAEARRPRTGQSWAAMALALSTSGPGSGTKIVCR